LHLAEENTVMKHFITGMRPLAIIAGCAFTAGGLFILLGDAVFTPRAWTTYQWLTILTVFGTICAGHLVGHSWRNRRPLAVVGFAVIFTAGTLLVVYQSAGRQAETIGNKAAASEHRNALISSKLEQRDKAIADLDALKLRIAAEIEGWPDARGRSTKAKGCGTDCRGFERQRDATQEQIDRLQREVADLGPPVTVNAQADYAAQLVALLGGDLNKWKGGLLLFMPFLTTMFFEIGIITALGYAFEHRPRSDRRVLVETPSDSPKVVVPSNPVKIRPDCTDRPDDRPDGGSPVNPRLPKPDRPEGRREEVLAALLTDLAIGRKFPSQRKISETYNVKRSTLCDWMGAWEGEGLIPARVKTGRCKSLVGA
jgi:hypothetical protein